MPEEKESKYSLEAFREVGKYLFDNLHLSTYPVAIKYIKDISDIPDGVKRIPEGKKMAICQTFTMARRFGDSYVISAKDNFCTPSSAGHGWVDITLEEFVESQVRQGWHKDANAEKRRAENVYNKNFKGVMTMGYRGLIASPLPETKILPDTVLLYGTGLQMTYVVHALNYEHKKKYKISSNFEGFGESCGKGGFIPHVFKKPQLVLPGAGDRTFGGAQDHEMAIGMPARHAFYVRDKLFKTGGGQGLGFPLKKMMPLNLNENITPGFKYMWEVIEKKLHQSQSRE